MTAALDGSVLVVDDTPSKRYVLASWLRRGGYPVVEAATGGEALTLVGQGGIGLVILDVRLPDLTGFEVCERIKSDPVHGSVPVIHVSAAAIHSVDRTQGLERGADAYLVEPIDPDELLATIASVLRYFQAREQAERLAHRLADLTRVTVAMSSAGSEAELLQVAARGAAGIYGSPAAVVTIGADGTRAAGVCAGPAEPVQTLSEVDTAAVADGQPLPGVSFHDQPPAGLPDAGWPPDEPVRVLTVRARTDQPAVTVMVPSRVTMDGAPVLTLLGQAVMSALNVQRLYDEEHDLALTLQRSLLPRTLPDVDGLEFAVRYVPASDRAEIGGDFYEVVRFGDQLMVAVGDVGGHSLHAATVMAELRHAMRAYLADGHAPAAVLDRLNHLMLQLLPGEIATLCLLAIDIPTGVVQMANAGHPPPLMHTPGRDGRSAPMGAGAGGRSGPIEAVVRRIEAHSALLGLHAAPAAQTAFELAVGDSLMLYTDGLVENRAEVFDVGLDRLSAAVAKLDGDLEEFATRLLEEIRPTTVDDDIAMVVVRRTARQ
jgi:serine phosphatase RsbU (regulator of sigma subunit)/DNA-binding NarL/FixJ family response regulator